MSTAPSFQPTIVIAGEDPEWVFAVQRELRAALGWEHDIVLTFAAHRALAYLQRRPTRLLIVTPQLMPGRDVDLADLISAVRAHPNPPRLLLAIESLPVDHEVTLSPAPIALPDATCHTALQLLRPQEMHRQGT
ncbi:MAG: hypothetical protein HC822_08280 [Oscillochloris sp.]|nr:hypothetical protein [Oscillochloris sp.]